jgi:ADP-ribose pyrophosphatase YjhB (NUDIX family)
VRALRDQLGLSIDSMILKEIESFKGRDGTWHMSFHHLVELPQRVELKPSNDLVEARWFALDQLPPRDEVAHHGWALDTIEAVMAEKS